MTIIDFHYDVYVGIKITITVGIVKNRLGLIGQRHFFVKQNPDAIFFLDISIPITYLFSYIR